MSAKVSVIVPAYNVEKYLERCVNSILEQSYDNVELILVDDGSPDNSALICDSFATQEERVRVIHKQNGGLASARLAGFEIATGEYVAFIDSDDYIARDMIEKMVFALENTEADLAMCGYYTATSGYIKTHLLPYQENMISGRGEVENRYLLPLIGRKDDEQVVPGFLWIRLLKRSLIQRSFFKSERVFYKEDHVFDLLYGDRIDKIAIVNEPLYYYCFNSDSLSNTYRKNKWTMYKNLYGFYLDYVRERGIEADSRLKNYVATSLFASVDNAVMSGSFVSYRKEIDEILSDDIAKKAIRTGRATGVSQWTTLLLLRMKLFRVLYFVRRKRLG